MADFMKPAPEPKTALGRHCILSSTAGIRVSPLALGTMSIGEAWSSFMGPLDKNGAFELLDAFHNAGGNLIDTANTYQDGQSEAWIGEWMHARQNRDEMVIATKYSFHYRAPTNADKTPANNNFWGNHKRSLRMSLRDSLERLQSEWVDILYVHFWDYTTSIEEIMDSLHSLVESGKVLYLGGSDTPAWVGGAANYYARSHGKTQFSIYQGQWNVLMRDLEREVLPMARYFGMVIAPWNALGGGKLQSEAQVAARKQSGDASARAGGEQTADERNMSAALLKIANAHRLDSVTAVALAYLRSKTTNVIPMVGGRKVKHLMDNIKCLNLKLIKEEIEALEGVKDFSIGFPVNFIGQDWRLTGQAALASKSQGPIDFS